MDFVLVERGRRGDSPPGPTFSSRPAPLLVPRVDIVDGVGVGIARIVVDAAATTLSRPRSRRLVPTAGGRGGPRLP